MAIACAGIYQLFCKEKQDSLISSWQGSIAAVVRGEYQWSRVYLQKWVSDRNPVYPRSGSQIETRFTPEVGLRSKPSLPQKWVSDQNPVYPRRGGPRSKPSLPPEAGPRSKPSLPQKGVSDRNPVYPLHFYRKEMKRNVCLCYRFSSREPALEKFLKLNSCSSLGRVRVMMDPPWL